MKTKYIKRLIERKHELIHKSKEEGLNEKEELELQNILLMLEMELEKVKQKASERYK